MEELNYTSGQVLTLEQDNELLICKLQIKLKKKKKKDSFHYMILNHFQGEHQEFL